MHEEEDKEKSLRQAHRRPRRSRAPRDRDTNPRRDRNTPLESKKTKNPLSSSSSSLDVRAVVVLVKKEKKKRLGGDLKLRCVVLLLLRELFPLLG